VLPPMRLREQFGDNPDVDAVYQHVVDTMQQALTSLAGARRLPVIG